MEALLIAILSFVLGFIIGGVMMLSACATESKKGTLHIGGKTYRTTPFS